MSFRQFQSMSPSRRITHFATTHKWLSIIGLSLAFVLLSLQPVRAEAVLNIVQTLVDPTGTTVFPYDTVVYKVSISCNSSEDPNCDNVIISNTLDPNLEYIAATPPPGFGAPIVNGNAFTLTAPAMQSGSTADLYITIRVRPTASPNVSIPHTVNIKIDNGPSNVPTTFVSNGPTLTVGQPTPQWSVEKVKLKPAGIDPAVDNNVTYSLNICSDKLSGNVDLASPVVEDIYPSGAIVVSTDGGVDNGTKLTWTLSTIEVLTLYPSGTAPNSKQCLTKKVVLRYPSPTYTKSSTISNQMSLTSTTLSGPLGDTLGHGFLDPTPLVRISKDSTSQQDRTNTSLAPGMLQTWKLSFDASAGNIDVVNPIITDTLPAYGVIESTHSITSGTWISTTKAHVEVSSDGTLWTPLPGSPIDGDDNKSWFSTTDFAADITHVRWRFFEEINGSQVYSVSQDFSASGLIIKQKVANTATDGQTFQNCASATAGTPAAACKTITVLDPKPELEPAKTVLNDPKPGDDVQIILAIGQGPNSSAAIVDPKMTDIISSYLEFVSWDAVTMPSGASEPYFVKTALPDGTTRLHFYWSSNNPLANSLKLDGTPATVPNSYTIPLGPTADDISGRNTVSVRITLRVKESTPKGDYPNDLYTSTTTPDFSCQPATGIFTETVDVDGNGASNDTLCTNRADVSVLPAVILLSQKWIKGDFPEDPTKPNVNSTTLLPPTGAPCPTRADVGVGFTRLPCVAQTDRGDIFTYTLRLENVGNIPATDYILYDVLPFVGDAGVSEILAGFPRKSVWRPALTGPIVPSDTLPSGTIIEYSDSSNSCRPEVNSAPADGAWQPGCINDWTSTPDVWGDVRSFRIKIPFASPNYYMPGQKIYINVFMRVPNGVPSKTIAWNALAQRATNAATNERLLAAEPPKVGILVPPQPAIFDLALQKRRADGQPYIVFPNRDVTFTLTITNQGEITASEVSLVDYFPDTFTLSPNESNWTGGAGSATRTLSGLNLAPGNSLSVNIILRASNINVGVYTNTAEIASSKSITGASLIDVDSTPDSTNDESLDTKNNATAAPGADGLIDALKDDIADEDAKLIPGADEDDHDIATVELVMVAIGNRVWLDAGPGSDMNNGKLDASETLSGVAGVQVQLFNRGDTPGVSTPVSETVTIADGYYQFDRLAPGEYFVHIPITNFVSSGVLYRTVSSLGGGGDESSEEDADENGQDTLVAGGYSSNIFDLQPWTENTTDLDLSYTGVLTDANVNLTADFAFVPAVAIGNRIWIDDGAGLDNSLINDGLLNGSELGIDAVTVELYRAGNSTAISTTETSNGGYYYFDMLPPGSYYVQIPASEFGVGQELEGYFSSTDNGTDETSDEDADENGIDDLAPWVNGIRTMIYELRPQTEMVDDLQDYYLGVLLDDSVNATADLGVWESLHLGDRLWIEYDGDGDATTGIVFPVVGQVVTATDGATLYTAVTDSNGRYTLTVPTNNTYTVTTGLPSGTLDTPTLGGNTGDDPTGNDNKNHDRMGTTVVVTTTDNLSIDYGFHLLVDFGDLPNAATATQSPAYSTTWAEGGPSHVIISDLGIGAIEDNEGDGPPNPNALGDDSDIDDEDGVTFAPIIAGQSTAITVSVRNDTRTSATLYGFIDFNGDGTFDDAGESANEPVPGNGAVTSVVLTFAVPVDADNTQLLGARFRISSDEVQTAYGAEPDGEVEDYLVSVVHYDLGDLPENTPGNYATLFANNGPAHIIVTGNNPFLGTTEDNEGDGQPTIGANGDDNNGDDEDGVAPFALIPGESVDIVVTYRNPQSQNVYLNAWLDVDGNGSLDPIATDQTLASGTGVVTLSVNVPATATIGTSYARFRISSQAQLELTGIAGDGEVEDYALQITPADYGDLPSTYTTLNADNGARHGIDGVTYLGAQVDADIDGEPSDDADGDDATDERDDEDGVTWPPVLPTNSTANITVTAAITGYLNAWIDFNGNGLLDVATERIGTIDQVLTPGINALSINVPGVITETLYSRFRFTANPDEATTPSGLAATGEVEDYVRYNLGNRVWLDNGVGGGTADDGVRNGSEVGIPNVTVELYRSGQLVATTSTDAQGHYLFASLADEQYEVRIPASNFNNPGDPLYGYASSTSWTSDDQDEDVNENGIDDSDPANNGILADSVTPRLAAGLGNMTVDFAFVAYDRGDLPDGPYATLSNNNGAQHLITPELYFGAGVDAEVDGQPDVYTGLGSNVAGDDQNGTDDEDGIVFMTPLMPGTTATISLTAHVSPSIGTANYGIFIDFNGNGDFNDAGESHTGTITDGVTAVNINVPTVVSDTIYARFRIAIDNEGASTDSGMAESGEVEDYVLMSLGNRIWLDNGIGGGTANDGALNGGEQGIRDVTLQLYRNGQLIATTTTDTQGHYLFTGLAEATYVVRVDPSNFATSNDRLYGYSSSTNSANDDQDETINENGIDNSNPAVNGISSAPITLSVGDEPTADGNNALSNLTVDFAFVAFDWGDLPDSSTAVDSPAYKTNLTDNGPRHLIVPGLGLGVVEDAETNGQSDSFATGDDLNNDDEESLGSIVTLGFVAGEAVTLTVNVTNTRGVTATLYGFIDFNGDGTFDDPNEVSTLVIPGNGSVTTALLPFTVPIGADGTQWLGVRLRISSDPALTADGLAPDGEVEDYLAEIIRYDFGDLPEDTAGSYPSTLANSGAQHVILPVNNPILGAIVDNEADGQPNTAATGDDTVTSDDEDGVIIPQMVPGRTVDVLVSYTNPQNNPVNFDGWMELDGDGVLEHVADRVQLPPGSGVYTITVTVVQGATRGVGYARFRIGSEGGDLGGSAAEGEVEDYAYLIGEVDYGDLPDIYGTRRADNGPRHMLDDVTFLGAQVDDDIDGAPSVDADGDNIGDASDDEEGVTWPDALMPGSLADLEIVASTAGYLNAWIDFNGDGDFNDSAERIVVTDTQLITGNNAIPISVPTFVTTTLYSRFRFTAAANQATMPTGLALSGEVEDYVRYALGNTVWLDNGIGGGTANNGALDGAEKGIAGVTVDLYRDGDDVENDAPIATTTSDANGHYLFTGLNDEGYFVYIPSSNFDDATDPLYEHLSSTGAADDTLDEDANENGIDSALPSLFGIASNGVNPRLNAGQSNLTVDFAFVAYDFGDLPTSQRTGTYPTLLFNDGPRHIVSPELYFGAQVDTESDGAPDVNTGLGGNPDGDDQGDANDDEDGIVFKMPLMANTTAQIEMTAYVTPELTAHYAAFIDFNNDGAFTSGEIFTGVVSNGVNTLLVNVPAGVADQVYARFRIATSLDKIGQPTGEALSGEVEDYVLMSLGNQLWFDNGFGNANDGTFDGNEAGVPAGVTVTLVLSGSNTPIATTMTDASGLYTFTGLSAGDYQVIVAAENFQPGGLLQGYQSTSTTESDPNADGEDNDNGIDSADPASTGIRSNPVNLLPGDEPDGNGLSNLRVDFGLIAYDWGDLPEAATALNSANYSTMAAGNGPNHLIIPGLSLGNSEDGESDGQATVDATGDDANGVSNDDEDGVQLPGRFMLGTSVQITATVVNENDQFVSVYAFIDWNGDGDFTDFAESQNDSIDTSGEIVFTFNVPNDADSTKLLAARFRLTSNDEAIATGGANDGEVEDYLIQVIALDLGDLPTGYPTLLSDNGASHVIDPIANPILGLMVDQETDGEPSGAADGDDVLDENDDEDGVTIPALIPGETVTVTVVYSNPTGAIVYLNAWLDVDGNFTLDPIATNLPVPIGSGTLEIPVAVPVSANPGDVYGRFRISSEQGLQPTGEASDGEVEDHQAAIVPLDYGDLPTNNTFYSDNGARHIIGSNFNPILGSQVDADGNGAPSTAADGDDLQDGNDDEDGVTIPQLVPGTTVTVNVTYDNPSEIPAYLNAWIDIDGDGDLDPIAVDIPVSFGSGTLEIAVNVPATAIPGDVPARFRISREQGLQPTGLTSDGEVEDYIVTILPLDYGDLPDATLGGTYPTGFGDDGARHVIGGIHLGLSVDDERNGQPSLNADGDDLNPVSADDEEGVTFRTPIMASTVFTVDVIASTAGFLNAWIDFNGNGLLEAGEQIASSQPMVSGVNTLSLLAPATISHTLYSRFRVTTDEAEATTPTGLASSGEVEDYLLMSLGDTVWADTGTGTTNNGVQDTSELGISGVLVELYREGQAPGVDTPIATVTTDENGTYLFTGLTPGDYIVSIPASEFATDKPLAGHASSGDVANGVGQDVDSDGDDGDDNGVDATMAGGRVSSQPVTLALGGEPSNDGNGVNSNQGVDLGFFIPVSLGNLVWNDINNNGQKDSNESGIAGVTLQLFREGDNPATTTPVATDVTDDVGTYLFTGLVPDSYFVYIPTPLAQYPASSTVTDPADNREDGDDNGAQTSFGTPVRSPVIDLSVGAEPGNDGDNVNGDLTIDFGFFTPATLGNLVWEDKDKDGTQDPDEPGVSGITVNLYDKNNLLITTTVTNGAGQYLFGNLPPGDYVIEFVLPPDFVITVPTQGGNGEQDSDVNQTTNRTVLVTIGAGQSNLSFDAGLVRVPTALDDTDEPGLFNQVFLPVVTR